MVMADLQPGDVLLYAPGRGVFGKLIALKTWHRISHVEVFVGDSQSIASRDGQGANVYPVRLSELAYVLRPTVPFNAAKARAWFDAHLNGQPYGWWDLAQFMGWNVDANGIVCSPCATLVLRAGDVPIFGREPAAKIAPCSFLLSELLTQVWPAVPATESGISLPAPAIM